MELQIEDLPPPSPGISLAEFDRSGRRIPMTDGDPQDGIISYLATQRDGNVHEKGIGRITSNSLEPLSCSAESAEFPTGPVITHGRETSNTPGPWARWDFRTRSPRVWNTWHRGLWRAPWMVACGRRLTDEQTVIISETVFLFPTAWAAH
jgi:hypothetical protein